MEPKRRKTEEFPSEGSGDSGAIDSMELSVDGGGDANDIGKIYSNSDDKDLDDDAGKLKVHPHEVARVEPSTDTKEVHFKSEGHSHEVSGVKSITNAKEVHFKREEHPHTVAGVKPSTHAKEVHFRGVRKRPQRRCAETVRTYDTTARRLCGAKAKTNFPMEINMENKADNFHIINQEWRTSEMCSGGITDDKPKPNANAEELHFRGVNTAEEAAKVYDTAAREFHGPKAKANFPLEIIVEIKADPFHTIIMDRTRELIKKKDIVCLILSYPPLNSMIKDRHKGWILNVIKMTWRVRELKVSSMEKEENVEELFSEIIRLLGHSIHDIEAYVPPDMIGEMQKETLESRMLEKEMCNLAINFATRQILEYIEIPEFRRIEISGVDDTRLLSRLKNLPLLRNKFNIVILVDASNCKTIEEIEDCLARELGHSRSSTRLQVDEVLKNENFLILLNNVDFCEGLDDVGTNWWNSKNIQKIVSTSRFYRVNHMQVDLEIRLKDHLLSWELFYRNVGEVHSSSIVIQLQAIHVLKQCCGHLLATVLMARALKGVNNVGIWEYSSHALQLLPPSQMEDRILFNALAFIWGLLGLADQRCVKYCASYLGKEGMSKVDLIERWIKGGLIGILDEGNEIIRNLVNGLLLESFQNGKSVRMREEIQKEFVKLFKTEMNPMLLELGGRELRQAPVDEAWKEAGRILLMNNKISKLPENPLCLKLSILLLQVNHHLRVIPSFFFEYMPVLQILDLSHTRIRSLPQSLFKLVQLRQFFLKHCELFMELPPEVGELSHLEVLDLEGTEIINLPATVGKLTNLRCLKVSFYGCNNTDRKNHQQDEVIPKNVIANLLQLEELSIDVNPDDERWNTTVKDIVKEVCSLNRLDSLKLYLPEVVLLNDLRSGSSSTKQSLMHYRFTVGSHMKRIISRLPLAVAGKFEEEKRCLKYVNGEVVPTEIKEVLQHATALFLDRHLTLTSLSQFGIGNMENLIFCVLGECDQIQTIVDTDNDGDVLLESLQYLNIHYMKNLRSIWKGPLGGRCLFSLKSLMLYTCPQLATVFTSNLLENLCNLEELVVEDCPEINSIVTGGYLPDLRPCMDYLPKLKKISLHYLPKLVNISSGLRIAPNLEWMSFYGCPSLRTLSPEECRLDNLKVIIGEADWWSALRWEKSEWLRMPNLDSIFVPIERYKDLMTQLAELNDRLQAWMQETKPSQQSGSDGSVKAPAVEAGTTSEEKQVYEPVPLSTFSTQEGGSIKALAVETGTTSKGKQHYESASLPLPTEGSDPMKAPAVEGGTNSQEKQLYEPVPLPFPREGGDSIKAPSVEAGTTLKGQLCEPAPSRMRQVEIMILTKQYRCIHSASCACTKGHLSENVIFLVFQQLNWNPKLIATLSCTCKWFDDLAKRVLWKEFCRARAPKMMLDLQSSGSHSVDGNWRALGKLLIYCSGCTKGGLFNSIQFPGHFVYRARFSRTSGKSFLLPQCRTDVLYVSDPCKHLDQGEEGDVGFFRGVFKSFSMSKVRKMLIKRGAQLHPTEVCPYCKAKLWSMLQAKMIPQSASCRLGAYEDCIEYYVCLNGHMLGICTLLPLSDSEEASE